MELGYVKMTIENMKDDMFDKFAQSDEYMDVEELLDEIDDMITQEANHLGDEDEVSVALEAKVEEAERYVDFVAC